MKDVTIRVRDPLGNLYYIRRRNSRWHCVTANGTPCTFSYAGILRDSVGFELKLDRARSAQSALQVTTAHTSYSAELL